MFYLLAFFRQNPALLSGLEIPSPLWYASFACGPGAQGSVPIHATLGKGSPDSSSVPHWTGAA
jgi:hypothetical protein